MCLSAKLHSFHRIYVFFLLFVFSLSFVYLSKKLISLFFKRFFALFVINNVSNYKIQIHKTTLHYSMQVKLLVRLFPSCQYSDSMYYYDTTSLKKIKCLLLI